MQNIEIKARCDDFERARSRVIALGGRHHAVLEQEDVYFVVARGRLKLRKMAEAGSYLIFYRRNNAIGPRQSTYERYDTDHALTLEKLLTAAFGVRVIVNKHREVYLIDNVRVHFDRVEGLGNFLEFEAVLEPGMSVEAESAKLEAFMQHLEIEPDALIAGSYADLLAEKP